MEKQKSKSEKSLLPTRLEDRIENALHRCRLANKETPENILCYSCVSASSTTAAGSQLCFKGYNSPDAFVVIVFSDKEDWKKLRYKLITTDEEKILPFVTPIVEEWIKDMWEYYS